MNNIMKIASLIAKGMEATSGIIMNCQNGYSTIICKPFKDKNVNTRGKVDTRQSLVLLDDDYLELKKKARESKDKDERFNIGVQADEIYKKRHAGLSDGTNTTSKWRMTFDIIPTLFTADFDTITGTTKEAVPIKLERFGTVSITTEDWAIGDKFNLLKISALTKTEVKTLDIASLDPNFKPDETYFRILCTGIGYDVPRLRTIYNPITRKSEITGLPDLSLVTESYAEWSSQNKVKMNYLGLLDDFVNRNTRILTGK